MFGNAFFRNEDYKMVTHGRVFSLSLKDQKMDEKIGQYLESSLFFLNQVFSYNNMASFNKLKNIEIILPICNNEISFEYMREKIEILEQEKINLLELEKKEFLDIYLKVAGLEKCNLNEEDKIILDKFNNINYQNYKIEELFHINPTNVYKKGYKEDLSKQKYPIISNRSSKNGINRYTSMPPNNKGNIITFSDTTDSAKTVFYQKDSFIGYSHVQCMYPIKFNLNQDIANYIITTFKKSIGKTYNYSVKFNRQIAYKTEIVLPEENGIINFDYMEKYIKVIKKLIIKDIIEMKDRRIRVMESIIDN